MGGIFNPENTFWRGIGRFTDYLLLSLLWVGCCLPVVTIGASTTALYDAVSHCLQGNEPSPYGRFWSTFKRELVPAGIQTVLWGILLVLLGFGIRYLWAYTVAEGPGSALFLALYGILALLPIGILCWVFPLLSRFTWTPMGLLGAAFRFALGYLPYTILAEAALLVAAVVSFLWMGLPLILAPTLVARFWATLMERAFRKHMPQEEIPAEGAIEALEESSQAFEEGGEE